MPLHSRKLLLIQFSVGLIIILERGRALMRNEREARNHAMHQLKEKVSSTTEIVCLDSWETLEKAVCKLANRV